MAADNTRKTSNVIHEIDDIKSDVNNNSQNIQNNTDAIDNISIPTVGDGNITLSNGTGINISGTDATANQAGDSGWSVSIDDTVALKSDIPTIPDIPTVPDNIVETLNNLTGNLTLESSDNTIGIADNGTDNINLTLNASLADLSDVSDTAPADDQILTYNGTSSTWEPAASQSGGVTTLAALDDTNVSTPEEGQTLVWNNTDSKWENKDASGGVSNLPISSTDGSVILDSPAENEFNITAASKERFKIDDGSTYILPKGPISSTYNDETLTNAARFYTDASKNYCGVGITSSTFNIAACNAVANLRLYTESQLVAAFNRSYTQFYINSVCQFVVGSYGTIGLGSNNGSGAGTAKSQGVRAVWNDQVVQNWISYYDLNIIQDQTGNDGSDPANPIIKNVYGHWVQHSTNDPTGGASPIAFYNPAPLGEGIFTRYVGFAAENCTNAKNAISFQSNQNAVGTVLQEGYSFYATGSAPARFNGGVNTNYITTQNAADTDCSLTLNGGNFTWRHNGQSYIKTSNPEAKVNAFYYYDTVASTTWLLADVIYGSNYDSGTAFAVGPEGVTKCASKGNMVIYCQDESKELRFAVGSKSFAGQQLTISIDDIKAFSGYVPQTDDSLVTKGWVQTNGGGGGTLPISSADDKVTLSDDGNGKFQIETGTTAENKAVRLQVTGEGVVKLCEQNDEISVGFNYLGSIYAEAGPSDGTGNLLLSGQFAGPPYFKDMVEITHDYNLIVNHGQVQSPAYTTKDAASGDPADGKNDGDKVIRLKGNQVQISDQDHDYGTGGYSLDIRDNRGTFRLRNDDVVNGINDTAKIVLDVNSNNYNTCFEFRAGNVVRAEIVKQGIAGNQYWAQYCSNGSASGLEFRTAFGTVTEKTFENHPNRTVISTFEQDNDPDSDNYRGIENYVDRLTITKDDIKASDDYVPQTDSSLVTKGYVTNTGGGMGTLPIYSDNGRARVDYLDFYDDPDKVSLIRLVNSDGSQLDDVTVASSLQMDGLGRMVLQTAASSTAQPLPNAAFATYAATDSGSSSRIGFSNRSKHYANEDNLNEDSGMEDVSYTYGFYSQPQFNNLRAVTSVDFAAVGPQEIKNSATNNAIGFFVSSSFANGLDHPTGGPPLKYGFRSDVAQEANKNQYAFFANGSAPSRFNSDIQVDTITTRAATTNNVQMLLQGAALNFYQDDADAQVGHFVYNSTSGHMATGIKGGYTPGSATVTFRKQLDDNASNTFVVRCDGPVFGNEGAAITKYGVAVYPDNRGDNVSFVAFDAGRYYDSTNFPDDPTTQFDNYTGYNVGNWWFNCTGKVAGFRSSISVDPNSTKNTATWQIECAGNAPSYFAGPIQYSSQDLITDDAHLVTKKYVDDQAGAAGLVPFGTPTDDTTPDSPNGSTLHDNMYLYVKGSTSWKKAALYPLDSTGGGSIFPIPQPGENSGEVWDTVQFTSGSSVIQNQAAVSRAGNVFFLANSWSVDGEDWYQCVWNYNGGQQTAQSYGIVNTECLTASAGNGVYCGWYGYSYDGQSWNLYDGGVRAIGSCFFWQGKHWSWGGQKYFDGEALQDTDNSNISGQIGSRPLVVASDSTLMVIDLTPDSDFSRGAVKRFVGNMATDGTWEPQGAGTSDFLQACHGVAWDGLSDKWVFITNSTAYVQKTSGNFSKSNFDEIALPTTATWAGLVHDGNRFVAVAENAGANVSIWSEDGRTWTISNDLNNPGLTSLAGFNGRVVGAGAFDGNDKATCIVTGNPTPVFRSFEVNGQTIKSQTQTNEFLLQEISRLQKLIEEKCDS